MNEMLLRGCMLKNTPVGDDQLLLRNLIKVQPFKVRHKPSLLTYHQSARLVPCYCACLQEIAGMVVYTGKETRIQMNAAKTPLKVGKCRPLLCTRVCSLLQALLV
jgi:magnesium-transporting ATPase (P-type)